MATKKQTMASEYKLSCKRTGEVIEASTIKTSADAVEVARNFYFDDINIYESFFIMLLNRANKVIGWAKISQGGVCNTIVDKKIICKYAIDTLANGVILVHNHLLKTEHCHPISAVSTSQNLDNIGQNMA